VTASEVVFTPPAGRRGVLDRAHVGDVEGALGTLSEHAARPRRGLRPRLAALAAISGPGLVVMAANNDAPGIGLYAQAGQDHGTRLLWLLAVLAPVILVTQELALRLGVVTGAGHARLIIERFGRRWGMFALADLLALNALTLIADFIGLALALGYFGVSRYVAAPIAAALLLGLVATGSFRHWERMMFVLFATTLAVVPLAVLDHAGARPAMLTGAGGAPGSSSTLLLVLALVGTTVAPWQLFVRQSNVVDKRITPRWLAYARIDTALGALVAVLGAGAVMLACAWAFAGTPEQGAFRDAGGVAHALHRDISPLAGTLFSIALIDAALLGAAAVALSSSYSVGDALGLRHSLHRPWSDARAFHLVYAAFVGLGAIVVLVPGLPLGAVTTGTQDLAGVLLPSATVFLLLLGNDRAILGPWVNPAWLNAIGIVIVSVLVGLSTVLVVHTARPGAELLVAAPVIALVLAVGLVAVVLDHARRPPVQAELDWTMPALERLAPQPRSRARQVVLVMLRVQLAVAVAALLAHAVGSG
jgi:Mn2+/Fe2+ NRAMP family transporter